MKFDDAYKALRWFADGLAQHYGTYTCFDKEDAYQAALEGLFEAVQTYDPARSDDFKGFARDRMRWKVHRYLRKTVDIKRHELIARRDEEWVDSFEDDRLELDALTEAHMAFERLEPVDKRIMSGVLRGESQAEIAEAVGLSERQVLRHRRGMEA